VSDLLDIPIGCLIVAIAIVLALAVGYAGLAAVDSLVYERRAFAAITSCEARRLESRRKFLSENVVCVPAYRATKNDSLTVQGLK